MDTTTLLLMIPHCSHPLVNAHHASTSLTRMKMMGMMDILRQEPRMRHFVRMLGNTRIVAAASAKRWGM